jgi:Required for nuclear transport of RNA pol II C-terminus 1/Required for nuclear transport of RNA pol II C-terminus 2
MAMRLWINFCINFKSASTLALMPVLNLLVQQGRVQPWLRTPLISALARLPLRPRGVQHTIEFILSVHPSNTGSSASASTGRGSAISHEALNSASRLLSSPPVGMSPADWFSGIAPQLFSLLDDEGEPEMDKATAFIIGFGILGRKQFGAPGMPGWRALVEPILHHIDPMIGSKDAAEANKPSANTIMNLQSHKILATSTEVAKSIRRLSALVTSHPHPSLAKRLLKPILLPLWSLSSWPGGNDKTEGQYRMPSMQLLKTFLQLSSPTKGAPNGPDGLSNTSNLSAILENLTFSGRLELGQVSWSYTLSEDGGIQIEEASRNVLHREIDPGSDFMRIDAAVTSFTTLLGTLPDYTVEISTLFIGLCRKWLTHSAKSKIPSVITRLEPVDDAEDVKARLIEAKVMQQMMTAFPEKLVDDSLQLLDLVAQVLSDFSDSKEGEQDTAEVALSLLNIVLTSQSFQVAPDNETFLASITRSLGFLSKQTHLNISSTTQNLLLLLKFRSTTNEAETTPLSTPTDQQLEDRKNYSLAMSYLTAPDSPPPVRAHGLELISSLIRENSPVLDIPSLLVLFSSLLQDSEEYIYLRVIQSFIQLSQKHPRAVMKDLIDRYVDQSEESELDQRLRLGEALLQVIQSNFLAFSGEAARSVCEGLLFVAGRRGYRTRTEQEQEKKNKLKRKQNMEAEEAWDGPVPQLDEVLDMQTQQENEVLSQIVSGWESKRGTEDIRIRASALSILGSVIEASLEGVGSKIVSTAVDLSIHILTLEPEPEKGILRRAAILLIISFVKALDTARAEGKKLGFGLVGQSLDDVMRILTYVEQTDNDGLVRQQAADVIEGLRSWQINALIPPQREQTEIRELAGLSISPSIVEDTNRIRPRIEEIE